MGVPAPSHLHHRSQRVAVSRLSHVAWGGSVCEAYQEHRQTQRKAAPPCPELAPCYPTPGSSHAAHTALTVATARNVRAHRVGISRLQRSTHNHAVVADPHVAPYAGCLNDTVTPDHSVVADGLLLYESEAPPEDINSMSRTRAAHNTALQGPTWKFLCMAAARQCRGLCNNVARFR